MIRTSFRGPLAQLVEQLAFNQLVAGSSPARPTISPNVLAPFSLVIVLCLSPKIVIYHCVTAIFCSAYSVDG